MPLKSTQTNKYATACFVQEAPSPSDYDRRGLKILTAIDGQHFCEFPATLQTFNCYNRMNRRYDPRNLCSVIDNDERIQTLLKQNKWRGEWNHPNPAIKGQQYSDIRMTIPDPDNTSHMISNNRLEGDRYRATIRTHSGTKVGQAVSSEIIDMGAVPSFSVRLLGNMIPNAPVNQPNMRVTRVITYDMVDFPSHRDADGDVKPINWNEYATLGESIEKVIFMQELAKYCVDQSENMQVVCESFQISPEELIGVTDRGSLEVGTTDGARLLIPMPEKVQREAINILLGRR